MDPSWTKVDVYQSDIVTVVLCISWYVYVYHLNLYFLLLFCVDYHWNFVVLGWFGCDCWSNICICNLSVFYNLLKLVGLATFEQ
jgi:hypothetical protein